MRYVTAMITAYNQQGVDSIIIKARGRAISRAVDVAEITRNRFITGLEIPAIEIETEQLPAMDGGTRGVSTIAISFRLPGDRELFEWDETRPKAEASEIKEPEAAVTEVAEPITVCDLRRQGDRQGDQREAGESRCRFRQGPRLLWSGSPLGDDGNIREDQC